MTIARTIVREMFMPAYFAAPGLRPTARNSNPVVDRNRSQLTIAATMRARMKPQWTRRPSMSGGSVADGRTFWLIGSSRPGRWKPSVLRTSMTTWYEM